MITRAGLAKTSRAHLRDAGILFKRGSYDGAAYLCGYAVEIALKVRICRTLRWAGFPSTPGEFQNVRSVQTHNFDALLLFSGVEDRIKPALSVPWGRVNTWNPELRYSRVGTQTAADAAGMIEATRIILGVLL